ncbi:MAG: bi-domain-containing oxidoreductase [Thermoguttaceae bacterium]|nr:bi-domain-containing oxidoreductase [Thermoguttaceae bacterium]
MELLAQKLLDGKMAVEEVPVPLLGPGMILVRNHYSLVSPGTEGTTVKSARKSLLAKAKERPKEAKAVLEMFRRQGAVATYRAVMKKLDAYSPLGYSCAGEAIAVGEGVEGFAVGDLVACAGVGYANHAEIVAVPKNLCVKLRPNADLRDAAFNTLGAIALQGTRQADLRLGETCAIIGLGLLGRLAAELLKASGVRTFGVDVDAAAVESARVANACEAVWRRDESALVSEIFARTDGLGVDAVIIAAGTSSLDPINFAGEIARKRGRVVMLGAAPTGFDRDPFYYRKELELRMACSYGPGRYDLGYEERGEEYPAAYVRWTENRNMAAFQELLAQKKISVDKMATHQFPFEESPKAYDLILKREEPFLGVLLKYDVEKPVDFSPISVSEPKGARIKGKATVASVATNGEERGNAEFGQKNATGVSERRAVRTLPESTLGVGFIGAGSYAQGNILPNLPKRTDIARIAVLTNGGATSKRVAEKFRFKCCVSKTEDIFQNADVDLVFVATRHDSHAQYALEALKNGKNVFVEKPLCLTLDEWAEIRRTLAEVGALNEEKREGNKKHDAKNEDWGENNGFQRRENVETRQRKGAAPSLTVGFNRRFAPLAVEMKRKLTAGAPTSAIYRVNAGAIPKDSWIQDVKLGGGRVLGEVCHFVDFLSWLNSSLPCAVFATATPDPNALNDVLSVSLRFENGSIGTIHYFANGAKGLAKERVEVYQGGTTQILDDFCRLETFGANGGRQVKKNRQNKGQKEMLAALFDATLAGKAGPIPVRDALRETLACFAVLESLTSRREIELSDF